MCIANMLTKRLRGDSDDARNAPDQHQHCKRQRLQHHNDVSDDTPQLLPPSSAINLTVDAELRALPAAPSTDFNSIVRPLIASGYLAWNDAISLSSVSQESRSAWKSQEQCYEGWNRLLDELDNANGTNRCSECENAIHPSTNRQLCRPDTWNDACQQRKPSFDGVFDLVMSSGFLSWKHRGSLRKVCRKARDTYQHRCMCPPRSQIIQVAQSVSIDPRFSGKYDLSSPYARCRQMVNYSTSIADSACSYFDTNAVLSAYEARRDEIASSPSTALHLEASLPIGMPDAGATAEFQRLYLTVMAMKKGQDELRENTPTRFLQTFRKLRCSEGSLEQRTTFRDSINEPLARSILQQHLSPSAGEELKRFMLQECYPTAAALEVFGPLARRTSMFGVFFNHLPPRRHQQTDNFWDGADNDHLDSDDEDNSDDFDGIPRFDLLLCPNANGADNDSTMSASFQGTAK